MKFMWGPEVGSFTQIILIIQEFCGETVEIMNELNRQNIPFIQNNTFHLFFKLDKLSFDKNNVQDVQLYRWCRTYKQEIDETKNSTFIFLGQHTVWKLLPQLGLPFYYYS